jgi:hypothetical protein
VRLAALREEPETVAHDHGVKPQVDLVDEVALEQPPEQPATAVELELAPELGFELARRLDQDGGGLFCCCASCFWTS